jgi:hypothetical protein
MNVADPSQNKHNLKQKKDERQLDFLPFIAKGMAQNRTIRRELDTLYAGGGLRLERVDETKACQYDRYYRQSDLETELYCRKAADFFYTSLHDDENGQKAAVALRQLLQKGWQPMYDYVQACGGEVPFEPFWREFLPQIYKATGKAGLYSPEKSVNNDFVIFLYLVILSGKNLSEQGLLFQEIFGACLRAQRKMRDKSYLTSLLPGKKS